MRYLASTGEIRRLPQADIERFVAAQRAKDSARPAPRVIASSKRQALDGSPCPRCGASGYSGCAHQFAAARPLPSGRRGVAINDAEDATASMVDCLDVMDEIDAFLKRLGASRAWFANSLNRSQTGRAGLYSSLTEGRAKVAALQKIRAFIKNHEGGLA